MGIKIIRDKKMMNYTFVNHDNLSLEKSGSDKSSSFKEGKADPDFRRMGERKSNKLKKSKIIRGHAMQGHSPVYE